MSAPVETRKSINVLKNISISRQIGVKMKILITGSDGFIAKNLIVELKNRGYNNLLLVNRETAEDTIQNYAAECNVLFHLAGVNRPEKEEEYLSGNVEFTEKLITYLKKNPKKVHIVFSSSIQADRENVYGVSKRKAEILLQNYVSLGKATLSIYRLPNVFGKWCKPDYNSVVATFCYHIARGETIQIHNPSAKIELIYIDDVIGTWIQDMELHEEIQEQYPKLETSFLLTVGELAHLLYQFADCRINFSLPNLSNEAEKKLYSTYLSYLESEQLKYPLKMNEDNRGSFTEFLKTEYSGQVSVNMIKPGIVKGNHWHHTKVEKFLVVKGNALIKLRHIVTGKKVEYKVSGERLEVVDIPVGYTHSIANIGSEDLVTIMWANEIFDKEKPDTYFEEVDRS